MSINISSDDEEVSASGLQPTGFLQAALINQRGHSSDTVDLYESDKENKSDNCVDLTQGNVDEGDHETILLSGSSTRSLKEWDIEGTASAHRRSASMESASTVELADPDVAFDELLSVATAPLTHVDSGVSQSGCSSSTLGSTTSGYCSASSNTKNQLSLDNGQGKTKRSTSAADRATKKRRLEEERLARVAANELNKIYKPGECMKYMQIELHPTLLQSWYMADLEREATAAGARLEPSADLFHEGLVMWSRRTERRLAAKEGQMQLTVAKEPCDRALLVQRAEEIAPYVKAHTLSSRLSDLRGIVDCKLTLVVFGVKDYFKSSGRRKKDPAPTMTEIELEMAFTDLLVSADCDSVAVNTASELALTVLHFTKAIAEAPYKKVKKACDEQADFYMRGDNKKCVSVDKDGRGLARLWQQMAAVLPHSSLEVARALCRVYGSPVAMYEAMQRPDAVNDLANVGVDRGGVAGSRARRLGPEFARRLHAFFTADDADMLLE